MQRKPPEPKQWDGSFRDRKCVHFSGTPRAFLFLDSLVPSWPLTIVFLVENRVFVLHSTVYELEVDFLEVIIAVGLGQKDKDSEASCYLNPVVQYIHITVKS